MINVVVVEDQELIRQSLEIILSDKPDIKLVGMAENGRDGLKLVKKLVPDIVLMDIRMPEFDGVQCIELIKEALPQVKIIVLTTFDDDEYVFNALKNGASGYLLKGISSKELIESIRTVARGGALINPNIASKVVKFFSQMANGDYRLKIDADAIDDLNRNELKIIQFIGKGMSNKEIAERMKFSEGTIRNYISIILDKLRLRDRTQIAIFSIQSGLDIKSID